jgi:uncharacterized protein (DUF1499 family)
MRRYTEPPPSRAAGLAQNAAAFAWLVAVIGIVATRAQWFPPMQGMAVLGAAIVIALLSLIFALFAFQHIWWTGAKGLGRGLTALLMAVALLAWPAFLAADAVRYPTLNDVTSDPTDPPSFARSRAALAARNGHVPAERDAFLNAAQLEAYPDLQPVSLDLQPDEAFALVQRAVANLGWQVIDQARPAGRTGIGRIDAIDRSLLLRFPDDVTIRIRPLVGETRIDIRSVSRFGRHDFGVNARRVQRFTEELNTLQEARP